MSQTVTISGENARVARSTHDGSYVVACPACEYWSQTKYWTLDKANARALSHDVMMHNVFRAAN